MLDLNNFGIDDCCKGSSITINCFHHTKHGVDSGDDGFRILTKFFVKRLIIIDVDLETEMALYTEYI